ncbi:MAG: hypothetical protein ACYCXE_05390 [Thermoleophilia bacterium]
MLTFPAITRFGSHFYGDEGDGIQNLWNIWHMRQSIEQHRWPYFAPEIHFPEGTTLLGHTLSPTNALAGAALESFLTPFQSYDLLVIFAFVASGLSAFLLAYYFCRSYWPSIIAGFIYAFSGYQMLHIGSHINLISLEWLPLFLLFWHKMLTRPRIHLGLIAALFLTLTFYTELYYFLYAAIAALLFLIVVAARAGIADFFHRERLKALAAFLAAIILTTCPFIIAFIAANHANPFQDNHNPVQFSIELLGPLMPGFLKAWYGQRLTVGEGVGESFLGITVLGLMGFAVFCRRDLKQRFLDGWLLVFGVFLLLSFGPFLHVGNINTGIPMPYDLLQKIMPLLSVAAMPNRMVVMAILAAAMIAALALAEIPRQIASPRWSALVIAVLALLIFAEYLPARAFHTTQPQPAAYAQALKKLPGSGAVFDDYYSSRNLYLMLFYEQMTYDRPVYGGYISRRPLSVIRKDAILHSDYSSGRYDALCGSGFRYIVTHGKVIANATPVFYDGYTRIYDLSAFDNNCRARLGS